MKAQRIVYRLLFVLMLVNGSVSALLWSETLTRLPSAISASIPYTLTQRVVVTIMPVDTRIRSYPAYPAIYDAASQGSPDEVWVHVWSQDKSNQTFTNYLLLMLPVRHLVLGHLLAATLPLTVLTLALGSVHRLRLLERIILWGTQ